MNDLLLFLTSVGCFETNHSCRSLGDHLINTYKILQKVNAPEAVCLAGGLHSIYGTNVFTKSTFTHNDRGLIAKKFGPRAEYLAYLFSIIDRPKCLESGDVGFYISADDLSDLRMIEVANLFEQGSNVALFPQILENFNKFLEK